MKPKALKIISYAWMWSVLVCFLSAGTSHAKVTLDPSQVIASRWLSWEDVRSGEKPEGLLPLPSNPWFDPARWGIAKGAAPLLTYWYALPALPPGPHQIRIGYVTQAYEAWLWTPDRMDKPLHLSRGKPDTDESMQYARMIDGILSFEVQEPEERWFLVLRVSYAGRNVGGLWEAPELGPGETLQQDFSRRLALAFVCLGFLSFLICYQGLMYLRRPQDTAHKWILLLAICVAMRVIGIERIFCYFDVFPGSSWALDLSYRFEYLSMAGVNLAMVPYIVSVFPLLQPKRKWQRLFLGITALGFAPFFIAPYESFPDLSWSAKIVLLPGLGFVVVGLFRALQERWPYARFLAAVAFIPILSFLLEMVTSTGGSGVRWTHLTGTLFAFSLSYLMARSSAYAFDRVEELSRDLMQEVARQTHEIRLQADQELHQAHDSLEKSEQLSQLGVLVASVGHDIASPCSTIRLSVSDLLRQEAEVRRLCEEIFSGDEETVRVGDLFRRHLDEVKLGLGYIELGERKIADLSDALRKQSRTEGDVTRGVDFEALIKECLVLARGRTKLFTIEFKTEEVPLIDCVRSRLGQVILNLLANAADALASKRDRLRAAGDTKFVGNIRLHLAAKELASVPGVQLVVADNGDGVPHSLREKIFEQFFTTKPAGVGTGIGLALCIKIIREHRGQIRVGDDAELGGARFDLWLPVHLSDTEGALS